MTATWPLLRLYAYAVAPAEVVQGGSVATTAAMQSALLEAHEKAKLDQALPVSFLLDTRTRTCDMRDNLLALAFGTGSAGAAAASRVASRLAGVMDHRSKACLLVTSIRGDTAGSARHVTVWTFPKDEAFQLSTRRSRVNLLDDIFSRSSKLRKAATFEGRNTRTQFLTGRVLDYQANISDRFIADYWVDRFLGAQLQVGSDEGTRFLAKTIRAAYDLLGDHPEGQEQLAAAIGAIRKSPKRRWSMSDFSRQYLDGRAADAFARSAPNEASLGAMFDFDRDLFDEQVHFRIYRLDTGVVVSAPVVEIGASVTVDNQNGSRYLTARGVVASQKIRTRGR